MDSPLTLDSIWMYRQSLYMSKARFVTHRQPWRLVLRNTVSEALELPFRKVLSAMANCLQGIAGKASAELCTLRAEALHASRGSFARLTREKAVEECALHGRHGQARVCTFNAGAEMHAAMHAPNNRLDAFSRIPSNPGARVFQSMACFHARAFPWTCR